MKVICDRAALVESLNLVSSAAVARTPKPVLSCVKLTVGDGVLTMLATDLELSVRISLSRVEVAEPGEALVPADKLGQIVRESNDPTLAIETEGDTVHIRGKGSHFKVYGLSPADFPSVPQFGGEADFEMGAGELNMLINQTVFATARENSRYAYNGVLMEREGTTLAMVATDGRRLALARGKCDAANDQSASAIIPTKALHLIQRLLDDPETTVRVKVNDNQILVATDQTLLTSSLVEGTFPPYRDVVPQNGDKKAVANTDVLASGVRQAALLVNQESKGIKLSFDGDKLMLSSRAPEMGEAEVEVELVRFEGEPMEIGMNPAYILDVLKVVESKEIQLDFKDSKKPGVIRSGNNYLYVIMPVNLH